MFIDELKHKIKIEEYRTRIMFMCENLDMFYTKRIQSMEKGREPWQSISKWVIENEKFPRHEQSQQRFLLYVILQTPVDFAALSEPKSGPITRFDWYKSW